MIEQRPRRHRRFVIYGTLILIVAPLVGLWLYLRLVSGQVLEYEVSPDGKYLAEYRLYYHGGATATSLKVVRVGTRVNPFRHTVIDALDYGGDLKIKWIDSRNLLISCPNPGNLDFYGGKETKWHDVSIHYDLDQCQIAGAAH